MKYTPRRYAQHLHVYAQTASHKEVEQVVAHIVKYFSRRGQITFLRQIVKEMISLDKKQKHIVDATLCSAHPLSEEAVGNLTSLLEKKLHRTVLVKTSVDPELICGSILLFDDTLIDSSLESRLQGLETHLTS